MMIRRSLVTLSLLSLVLPAVGAHAAGYPTNVCVSSKQKEAGKADAAAAKAAVLGTSDLLVLKTLAIYYAEANEIVKAADAQAQYSGLAPQDTAAREKAESLYFEAAQPLLQQQKFSEAIPLLRRATERLAGSAQLELALGVAYYGLRRFDEAAAAFLRTIAIAPETE